MVVDGSGCYKWLPACTLREGISQLTIPETYSPYRQTDGSILLECSHHPTLNQNALYLFGVVAAVVVMVVAVAVVAAVVCE